VNGITKEAILRGEARARHVAFMRHCWARDTPFLVGRHTSAICAKIDEAFKRFRAGQSTFLCLRVPFRHGKSDLVSRYLVPHFLGEFPDDEIILATYGASLSYGFSKFSRSLVMADAYRELYPNVALARHDRSVEEWSVEGHTGAVRYSGLLGTITGKGGSLLVLDDFLRSREEAESQVIRDKLWDAFTNDFLTRRAPVAIVIVLATPWHVDDIFGRIDAAMANDENFPAFETLTFPAMSDEYESGYLFPERFGPEWYDSQAATLGTYGTASLLQCNPVVRQGGMLPVDKVRVVDEMPEGLRWVRAWDLASSTKQRLKDDPDYTVGLRMAVDWAPTATKGISVPILYIDDIIRGQWEARKRNDTILSAAMGDGEHVRIGIEAFAGYKDAYTELSDLLRGVRTVVKAQLAGDKVSKAGPLEPAFEAGNVYLKRAPWNRDFLTECVQFPGGKHDDQVDAMAVGYWMHTKKAVARSARVPI